METETRIERTFCGAVSSYGISNLFNLVKDTHKFEARYMEKLIGCRVDDEGGEKVYRERSPAFHAERVKTPLLVRIRISLFSVLLLNVVGNIRMTAPPGQHRPSCPAGAVEGNGEGDRGTRWKR